jgi:predicted metal-binding membrane protein
MWTAMVLAMMLPSAVPMVLMATRMGRARQDAGGPAFATGAFAGGYLLAWAGFSLVAAAIQTGLQEGIVSGHEMAIAIAQVAGGILIAAGLYQWTPLKHVCLAKCRSPLGFFLSHWRGGALGALRMGLHHGLYCIGCCWLLMALLFVAGVMALPWVGALGALVLVEKLAPKGEWVARAGGLAMLGAGVYLIAAG